MISLLRWPLRRIILVGALWVVLILLLALSRPPSTAEYRLESDGSRIWSALILMPHPWIYWLAFGPPLALLLYRAWPR